MLGFSQDDMQEMTTAFSFPNIFQKKDDLQEMITTSSFHAHILKEKQPLLEVTDYHLIIDLNGVHFPTSEGQTKSRAMVLRFGLKEFLSTCVNFFMVYTWFSTMKINFLRHLEIITKKISICLLFHRIMDQLFCFKNDHFLH
jgi:hypothetical protein